MRTRTLTRRLWKNLSKKRKFQAKILLLLMITSSFSEVIALSSLLPFLATLNNPQQVWDTRFVQELLIPIFRLDFPNQIIFPLTLIFISANLISSFLRIVNVWFAGRLAASIGTDFGTKLFKNLLNQDYILHIQRNTSDIIAITTTQVNQTVLAVYRILEFIAAALIVFALLMSVSIIDFKSTLIVFSSLILIYIFIAIITKNKLSNNSQIYSKNISNQVKVIQEGLGSIREILLGAQQSQYVNTYRFFDHKMRLSQSQNRVMGAFPKYILEGIGLSIIAIIGAISFNDQNSLEIISKLGIIALGAQKILPATQQSYIAWTGIKGVQKSIQNVLQLLEGNTNQNRYIKKNNFKFSFNKSITLNRVSFRYSKDLSYVIDNVDLSIAKGQVIGIKGSTGCGKSTLIDIIAGLLEPTRGKILVDNLDLHNLQNKSLSQSWRNLISYVPQVIYLSDKSISENIVFSDKDDEIDENLLIEVTKAAQLFGFISSLKDGFNTIVGERGVRLSGGQRQRLGIARALYKKQPILILDEATSALDLETEKKLMVEIYNLNPKPTIILVAHRLSTLYNCDKIIDLG